MGAVDCGNRYCEHLDISEYGVLSTEYSVPILPQELPMSTTKNCPKAKKQTPPREESEQDQSSPVSKVAKKDPPVNQKTTDQVVVTCGEPTASVSPADTFPREETTRKTCIKDPPLVGIGAADGSGVIGNSDSPLPSTPQPKSPDPGHESRTASRSPAVNQTSPTCEVASPVLNAPSGDGPDSPKSVSQRLNQMNQAGVPALARLKNVAPPEGGTPTPPKWMPQP